MMEKPDRTLAIVQCAPGLGDFVGELLDSDCTANAVVLKNAMSLEYEAATYFPKLTFATAPTELVSPLKGDVITSINRQNVIAVIELPWDSEHGVVDMYRTAFNQ